MTLGYTCGVFDSFHYGHAELLTRAAALCDRLIVGVTTDECCLKCKNMTTTFKQEHRKRVVECIRGVNCVVYQNELDKFTAWEKLKFDILFVGDDWFKNPKWIEYEDRLKQVGVKIMYISRTPKISSTHVRIHGTTHNI